VDMIRLLSFGSLILDKLLQVPRNDFSRTRPPVVAPKRAYAGQRSGRTK
jgi:hypothetical protein